MIKVLFILDRYCCGKPNLGLTHLLENHVGSFVSSGYGTYEILYLMPEQLWSSDDIDWALTNYEYDMAFISSAFHKNASMECVDNLTKAGKKMVMCWCDGALMRQESDPACHWWEYAKVCPQLLMDIGDKDTKEHNIVPISAPQDDRLFNTDNTTEEIDVVFAGCLVTKLNRVEYVNYVRNQGINIVAAGGRGDWHPAYSNLSAEGYVELIKKAKICININGGHGGGFPKIRNSRIFETLACGKALVTDGAEILHGNHYGDWLIPNEEFLPYEGPIELVQQIRYLLERDDIRKKIAHNGHKKYIQEYSAKPVWRKILGSVGIKV